MDEIASTFNGVKQGIDELSQLNIVYITIADIKKMVTTYERQTKGTDSETDTYLNDKENHQNWLDSKNQKGDIVYDKENPGLKIEKESSVWYHPKSGKNQLFRIFSKKSVFPNIFKKMYFCSSSFLLLLLFSLEKYRILI